METNLWAAYPSTYRAREMKILVGWISAGESGSVVGLSGCGRSNLLGFLCYRPDVLQTYLQPRADSVTLIQVDFNNLPTNNLSTLYRVILRSFYRVCYIVGITQEATYLPDPNKPAYLVTWRGKPEGGYQFFPEGRPG